MSETVTPEAGAQPQEPTSEVENTAAGPVEQAGQTEPTAESQEPAEPKVVPLGALHEERQRRKELQGQVKAMEERFNQFASVVSQRLQPQQQAPQIPDVQSDPVGHFQAENQQLRQQLETLGRPVQEIQQRLQAQEQMQRLNMHVTNQERQFAQQVPDYYEALEHVKTRGVAGLKALGYNDHAAQALVTQEYAKMAHNLAVQNENVAQHIYELAKASGYTPKPSGQDKLQAVKTGVAASRSLGSGGGVTQKLSLAALADMPADEFAKAIGDEDNWRKLMGG